MSLEDLRSERKRRIRRRRARSAAIASLCAIVMLALTAGVFAVASTSREVAQQSSRVHQFDQAISSATLVRAELGFGLVLADVDRFIGIDADRAVLDAQSDVETSLRSLRAARLALEATPAGLDPETTAAFIAFEGLALARLPLSAETSLDPATVEELDQAFRLVSSLLVGERREAIESVEHADATLGRLSTLVSFLTAFVIPSLALVIYRLLSAPQRELLEAEAQTSRITAIGEVRRAIVLRRLASLRQHAAKVAGGEASDASLAHHVDDVRRTVLTLERAQQCVFADVSLSDAVARAASARTVDLRIDHRGDLDAVAWTDADLLDLLLASIVADCSGRQASSIQITTSTSGGEVSLVVDHDGALRSPTECGVFTTQATIADRLALLGGPDVDLVTALHLTQDLQGHLEIQSLANDRQRFLLVLPAGTTPAGGLSPSDRVEALPIGAGA